jgi:Protein of unknown function (DUF3592)
MRLRSSQNALAAAAVVGSSLLGFALMAVAWWDYRGQDRFLESAWPVRAEIVALEPVGSDLSRGNPIASFTTIHGDQMRVPLPGSDISLGDSVNLLYNEDAPEDVRINDYWSLWFESWAFGVAGGFLAAVPLAALLWEKRAGAAAEGSAATR